VRLTGARRNGLWALLAVHPRTARRSNTTEVFGHFGCVYWQTADWLVGEGLAERMPGVGYDELRLTERGLEAARETPA